MVLFARACYIIFLDSYFQAASAYYYNGEDRTEAGNATGLVHDNIRPRIINGNAITGIEDYPFFAMLDNCGASIISDTWIITAAHCVLDDVLMPPIYPKTVCVGGTTRDSCVEYTYNRIVIHPGYEGIETIKDDVALLQLNQRLMLSAQILPIQLSRTQFTSGWLTLVAKGTDETGYVSDKVQMVFLYGYNDDSCKVRGYGEAFCAVRDRYEPGTCNGDSGSPMVRGGTLVGITSAIGAKNCNQNKYTFAINVAYYVPWIQFITGIC